jgi:hypothetical protein
MRFAVVPFENIFASGPSERSASALFLVLPNQYFAGNLSFGMVARNSARDGILPGDRAGKILTRGRPLRVTITSPSSATI